MTLGKSLLLKRLPRLVVFDLDYHLWPLGVDEFIFKPPYRIHYDHNASKKKILDAHGKEMKPYPEVETCLEGFRLLGCKLACASRTKFPPGARQLLQLLDWDRHFSYKEIYPGIKLQHFKALRDQSGFEYRDMLFFDDEERNIKDISPLGVTCVLVPREEGFCKAIAEKGLKLFNDNSSADPSPQDSIHVKPQETMERQSA